MRPKKPDFRQQLGVSSHAGARRVNTYISACNETEVLDMSSLKEVFYKPFIHAVVAGIAFSFVITFAVCLWEWIENPGGIFHGPDGTRWGFVLDTAISWFVPTLLNAFFIFGLILFGYNWLSFYRAMGKSQSSTEDAL